MAGLIDQGFILKRFTELLTEGRTKATDIFQDLVSPGDSVDTSDSSLLGRLIALKTDSEAELWETMQQVYSAFDPNSAVGIALDNLVAYGGLVREEQTYSTAQVLVTGDINVTIPAGSRFSTSSSSVQWQLVADTILNAANASGISVYPSTVANTTTYIINYSTSNTTNTITYTSTTGTTRESINNGLLAVINSSHPTLVANITGAANTSTLNIMRDDEFSTVTFSTSSTLAISKVTKVAEIQATTVGPVEAETGTITTIISSMLGLDSVINIGPASLGTNRETDEELRNRFRASKYLKASNSIESLFSALFEIDSVEQVRIYENDTDNVDSLGVPPHSFLPIVLGGLGSDIANTIWTKKPMGIESAGDIIVQVFDSQGFGHNIGYSRPDPVPIYITIEITALGSFPATGPDEIRSAIIEYFVNNQGIGDDVVYSRLYTPINSVPNFQVDSLLIGTSASPTGQSNIVINFDQIATISASNINII